MATLGSIAVKLGLDPSQFRNGLISARSSLASFKASINDSDSRVGKFVKTLERIGSSAKEKVVEVAKLGVQIGAVASTALTAAPYLIKAGTAIHQFGAAAVAAAPMLLAFGAAGLVVKATFAQIGPAIGKSLDPITQSLNKAGERASALATKGIPDLAQGFATANFPAISQGMDSIAVSTNRVIERFLTWGQSTYGVTAIQNLMVATSAAVAKLGPYISLVVAAFGNMIGRIAEVSLSAGANGLSGVLLKLVDGMNRVNAASVLAGLNKMRDDYIAVAQAVGKAVDFIKAATAFWHEHRQAILAVQDAVSVLAIVFGGPLIAVVAIIGLVIRHWDQLKAAYAAVVSYFSGNPIGSGLFTDLMSAVNTVVPALQSAWKAIWAAIGPVLTEIWTKITTQLVPAFGQFIAAIAPVVGFLVGVLAPVVASVFENVLSIISGAISIITGIFQVLSGILTGNWSRVWEGIKNILSGAWEAIVGIFNLWIFGKIAGILGRLAGFLGKFFIDAGAGILRAVGEWVANLIGRVGGIPGQILSALGNLGGLLYQAGRNVIQGLINGIWSMVSAVGSAIGSIAQKIRNALPFSPAKEGPLSGRGSPDIAGTKISSMLAAGMLKQLPVVEGMAARLATAASVTGLAALPGLPTLPGIAGLKTSAPGREARVVDLRAADELSSGILRMLRKAVHGLGGDVQIALGS